jgi:hypothetical protein
MNTNPQNGKEVKEMSTVDLDKVKDKLEKLLALAASDNENEADLAMKRAGEIAARYQLDLTEFKTGQAAKEEMARIDVDGLTKTRQFMTWESILANSIGRSFDCKVVMLSRQGAQWRVAFLGRKRDLELSIHFHDYLRNLIHRRARFFFKGDRTNQSTYSMSMTQTISKRLKEMYQYKKEAVDGASTALVRINQEVDDFTKTIFPSLRMSRTSIPNGSREAWALGRRHGSEIPLSRPVGGASGSKGQIR